MKVASNILLLWFAFGATFALAANNIPQVQHVIIVIQENRTPDNLFNQDAVLIGNGGHVQPNFANQTSNAGPCLQPNGPDQYIPLASTSLYTCWDPDHSHGPYTTGKGAWEKTWHLGGMDGACTDMIKWSGANFCGTDPSDKPACATSGPNGSNACPYAYVNNTPWSAPPSTKHILDPYFQLANQYGFANYMFQTNQGPSFPAHQFLLSGTSAPDAFNGDSCDNFPCYQWFAAENYASAGGWGCASTSSNIWELDPSRSVPNDEFQYIYNNGIPCYNHHTLVDLLGSSVTWKYYARSVDPGKDLWTAPNAIQNICQPEHGTYGACQGTAWQTNVRDVTADYGTNDSAPILDDIENTNCNKLPNVSWVIPDGDWSDHAGGNNSPGDGGPSWVAAIVNAIGSSACGYWNNTVVLVTWGWGGWYDDVVPPDCQTATCTGYSNGTGQKYVYGFRVPLLVIGAYVKPGYISGGGIFPPNCAPPNTYCHDFGSILNFIEFAFGLSQGGIGDPNWPYADALVMDTAASPNNYSLYDFFDFTTSHQFQPINGAKYPEYCFRTPKQAGCFPSYPQDPDSDAGEGD